MPNIPSGANYRKHRVRVDHPKFSPRSAQSERTSQISSASFSGAAVAIRPQKSAIRRYNNAGQGEVGYF